MAVEINYISIRRFAHKAKDWTNYLYVHKTKIAFAFALGVSIGLLFAVFTKPTYTGNLTFVLSSETNNSSMGGLLALANQFGLSFGNKNNAFSGENIVQLFRSKKMFQRAMFQTNADSNQLIINRIGEDEGFYAKWRKDERVASMIPFSAADISVTGVKDSLINEIYKFALTHYIRIDKIEKELNFYKISVTTHDAYVSSYLPVALVNETAQFYIEIKQEVAQRNLSMLQKEADSLRKVMNTSLTKSLVQRQQIFNLNSAMPSSEASAKQTEVQTRVLQSTYTTVTENMQIAKMTLQKITPVYQVIDQPGPALKAEKISAFSSIGLGAFLTTFSFVFFLLIQKTLIDSRISDSNSQA